MTQVATHSAWLFTLLNPTCAQSFPLQLSHLSPEAAAAYTDENYEKHLAARKEFEAFGAGAAGTVRRDFVW